MSVRLRSMPYVTNVQRMLLQFINRNSCHQFHRSIALRQIYRFLPLSLNTILVFTSFKGFDNFYSYSNRLMSVYNIYANRNRKLKQQVMKLNAIFPAVNKLCLHNMSPPPASWPFDLESWVRVMCDVGYLCANFSLPRPLYSRLRPYVRDRRQMSDVRQTDIKKKR